MAKNLTQLSIDNMRPSPVRREVADGKESGLYFIMQPSGACGWALRYRFDGRPRKLTIGPYPEIGLAKARAAAARAKGSIADRVDPGAEKKAQRATAKAAR